MMASRSSKRLIDDCALPITKKKKKISIEKYDLDVLKEKTTINSHSRQKIAFFAYFGKTLDKDKKCSANSNGYNTEKELINEQPNISINDERVLMLIDKNKKKITEDKSNIQYFNNNVK